ncbi:unnamed protein product, partial [Anisakis simplex]|uniref:E3 ubiquitin-protein ligase RBBP6 n=1 Tax=Anisakis simplex TaxID=6269 RepID=A0A0M3J587_ANISI
MSRQSDQSKHFCGAAGSGQGQSITVKFWTQSNMENLTEEMDCEALKQLVREMRYTYCQNVIHATQNGDIVATEAYQRQVEKLDDIFAKIHKGVQPGETIELPPMPKSYGPTPRPAPHYPHYPPGFPQQRMPFFSSYSSVLPSAADYQQPFAMQPEGYVPPPSYTDAVSLGGFRSLLTATESSQNATFSSSEQQRQQQSPTSRGIAETVRTRETSTPAPVAIGVQREPKVNSSARESIANNYENKAVKTEQDTIVRQTNPVKTERELTTSDGKEMDRTKTGKLQSATEETAKPPQSPSKITPEKQKR